MGVAATTLEANWFRGKELSFGLGLDVSVSNLGTFINDAVEPFIYSRTQSLSFAFFVGFLVCVLSFGCALVAFFMERWRENNRTQRKALLAPMTVSDIFALPTEFWLICAAIITGTGPLALFSNVASEFYQVKYGFSTQTAGTVIGLHALVVACCVPILGMVVDRYENYVLIGTVVS